MCPTEAATRRLLFVCTALLLVVCHAFAGSPQCESGSLRLPKRIKPIHYDVKLSLDWEKLQFKGRVAIDIEFDEAAAKNDLVCKYNGTPPPFCDTKKIILHAGRRLEIETVEFGATSSSPTRISVPGICSKTPVNFCRDGSEDQLILELDYAFETTGQLVLTYTGQLKKDESKGFFLSEEHDSQGEYTPLWVTSLEPGWARTVFPCFDEPDLKATFKVTIEHPQGLTALSNMHEIGRLESNDRAEVQFERTPKMSTHLFAVAIGEMDHIETRQPNSEITFRAWAPTGRAEEARDSLNLIAKSYQSFAKYSNVEQPLEKIDFISVKSFSRGMGGNWGLVTVTPQVLLDGLERRQTSFSIQSVRDTRRTILREMAHFWFGNLVTMKWWDDLWLSEGFASLVANIKTNEMFPEYCGEHLDLIYEHSNALNMMTSSEFAHPIKQSSLQTMEEIVESVDGITHQKAAAVLKMVSNYIGDESFQTGIRKYIKKFMYKNAEADDLWNSLSEVSGKIDVGAIMNSWIQNEKIPLVEASLEKPNFLKRYHSSLRLRQRKFPIGRESTDQKLWQIPISILVSNGKEKIETMKILLTSKEAEIALPRWFRAYKPSHFIKINRDFNGLYRVLYHDDMLQALKEPIGDKKILSPADRMNLLDDYLALHKVGLVDLDKLRDLMSWFKGEEHELVIMTLNSIMDHYPEPLRLQNEEGFSILEDYFHNKLEPTLNVPEEDLFGNKENLLQTIVRVRVLFSLARFRYIPALNFLLKYFRSRYEEVAHYMMKSTYSAVALTGTNGEYERMKQRLDELTGDEGTDLIQSLRRVLKYDWNRHVDFERHFRRRI